VGPDGATHQAIEDIAIMRVMPNIFVLAPCDVHEARRMTEWAAAHTGPVYMRLARDKSAVLTTVDCPFEYGVAKTLAIKSDNHPVSVGIVTTGILGHEALLAAKKLEAEGVSASVLHVGTIKPLDTESIEVFAKTHDVLITLEEHQVAGGLGGAVCEHLAAVNPTKVVRLGIKDQFGQSGTPTELWAHYGLDAAAVVQAAKAAVM
ncbi:MAG: transketolase C-terminal domain-containing protein, partial [Bacteroidota bacterium]